MKLIAGTIASAFALVSFAAQPALGVTAREVRVTLTSSWTPASPDPSGLTYRKSTNRLLISDAEVDEIPALWVKKNTFEMTLNGVLKARGKVKPPASDPEDVAWDSTGPAVYVADDDTDKIYRINPGLDGRIGSTDDSVSTALSMHTLGSNDPEGLAYRASDRSLFVSDGASATIFHVRRGVDGQFGTLDDDVRSFDAAAIGMRDPEDLEFDPASHHLFIVSGKDKAIAETTAAGGLVNTIDIAFSGIVHPAGITLAPGSDVRTERHVYVADRGLDNDVSPGENDGRIFEFALGA